MTTQLGPRLSISASALFTSKRWIDQRLMGRVIYTFSRVVLRVIEHPEKTLTLWHYQKEAGSCMLSSDGCKREVNMQVERANSNDQLVDKLPDGSRVIVDPKNETVFALNATAGAAWDACSGPTTLSKVAEDMQRSLDPRITEELALEALLQLQEQKLVTTTGSSSKATRREVFATLSGIAVPLVVSLTMAEQRAHAQSVGSGGHHHHHHDD
jgi:hypothetical protein